MDVSTRGCDDLVDGEAAVGTGSWLALGRAGETATRGREDLLPTATPGLGSEAPCPPRARARQDGERWAAALQRAQREALEREATRGAEQARQQELIRDMKGRLLELLR